MTIKEMIFTGTGCKTIAALKRKLKASAVYEYGGYHSEITTSNFRVYYTDNKNCYCKYGVLFGKCGMSCDFALDQASITKAGVARGCGNYYLTEQILNTEVK